MELHAHKPFASFAAISAPASGQATVTVAAPGAGKRLVVTAVHASQASGTTAPAATGIQVKLINGASGGSDVRWSARTGVLATAGQSTLVGQSELWIVMDENTAVTLEFSAGVTNTTQSVSISGYVIPL